MPDRAQGPLGELRNDLGVLARRAASLSESFAELPKQIASEKSVQPSELPGLDF